MSDPAILSGKGDVSRNKSPYFVYGTLTGLIISKVFTLNRETIFQSECPDLPFIVQELKDMVSQLMSKDISEKEIAELYVILGCSAKSESIQRISFWFKNIPSLLAINACI